MKIRFLILGILLLGTIFEGSRSLYGQDVPDSKRWLKEGKNLKDRIEAGMDLAAYYQYTHPDSAAYYLRTVYSLLKNSGKNELIAEYLYEIANMYNKMGLLKLALKYYEEGYVLYDQLGETRKLALCYQSAGFILMKMKRPASAIENMVTSLSYAQAINDSNTIAIVFYYLGSIYHEIDENKAVALDYLYKAKQYAEGKKDYKLLMPVLGGIGSLYSAMGNFEESEKYRYQVLEFFHAEGDSNNIAMALMNIGNDYRKTKKYKQAESFYKEAFSIYQQQNNTFGSIDVYINLGILYNEQKLFDQSISTMHQALKYAQQYGDQQDKLEIVENIGLAFEQLNRYDSAFYYLKYFQSLSDSIQFETEKDRYKELQIAYETDQKDKELAEARALFLEKEKQQQRDQFWKILLGLIGLFTSILAAGLYRRYLFKQRTAVLLEAKNNEIILAKEKAEQSEQSKQNFLSAMSHEIRTPLNAIVGFSELLQGSDLHGKEKQYVQSLSHASQHLLTLLNTVLDINKLNEKELQVNPSVFNTNLLKHRLNAIFEYMSQEKGVRWYLEADLPEYLFSDPHRILQIAVNLCSNAIKFTQKGSVEVYLEVLKESNQPQLVVEVRDTGIGIAPERLGHLFEKFGTSGTSDQSGTGLGLYISRQLALLMGGDVEVSSTPGKGSVFSLVIPVHIPLREEMFASADVNNHSIAGNTIQKIFIAEDNSYNQTVIYDLLTRYLPKATINMFDNGKLLWEALQKELPDIIIIDRHMPVMDGLELSRKIKASPFDAINRLPLIALSASVTKEEQDEIKKAGADFFLEKPLNIQALLGLLAQWDTMKVLKNEAIPYSSSSSRVPIAFRDTRLYEFAEGDYTKMNSEFNKFVLHYQETIRPGLEAACQRKDFKSIQKNLHDLRPQLRFVGMFDWEAVALNLEDRCRQSKDEGIEISKECKTFLTNLDHAMSKHGELIIAG
jgi:signal transduction histidine kinase/CheY-like chemotaxis protein